MILSFVWTSERLSVGSGIALKTEVNSEMVLVFSMEWCREFCFFYNGCRKLVTDPCCK